LGENKIKEVKMVKSSRLITTTILGLVFGIIVMLLKRYVGEPDPFWPDGISMLLIVTLLGVVIGASALKMNWAAHGALWGALFGVFWAINVVGEASYLPCEFAGSVICGFLIETLATKAFKQPQ